MQNNSISREARYDTIRAAGFGDKLDRLITLLAGHRAAFEEVIALEGQGPTRVANMIIAEKVKSARGGIKAIERTLDDPQISGSAYGSLGDWGQNGRAPQVADLVRSARFHAKAEIAA